ncbi:MAG: hypothetical protein CL878_12010 [Dehalococcoidia bacterium]|nr:hypothetical protein [Dehalococcoidia bacterium]
MIATTLFRLGMTIAPRLPRRLTYASARAFASLLTIAGSSGFRAATANQAVLHGLPASAPSVRAAARGALINQALNYVDLLRLGRLPVATLLQRIDVSGYEHLQQAHTSAQGVLIVSGHIGNLDVVGQVLALRGHRALVPVERIHPPRLFQYVSALRARHGLTLVPAEEALRPALRTLRKGGIVTFINDWDRQGNGVPVRFFGRETRLPAAPAVLHLRTGAPIVPCFVHRREGGRYAAWAEEPIRVAATGGAERDIPAIMQGVAASLEAAIRRDPTQWVLFHPVWPGPAEAVVEPDSLGGTGRSLASED